MKHLRKDIPPVWAHRFFRWFCHSAFREDIEGDLLEQFNTRIVTIGVRKARWLFIKDVFLLFRSGIIKDMIGSFDQNSITMKRIDWLKLFAVNLLVVLLILSPFIPGPYNKMVGVFSFAGQLTGVIGLLLVPIALAWTIIEIQKSKTGKEKVMSAGAQYQLAVIAVLLIAAAFLIGVILLPNPMPKLSFLFGLVLVLSGFFLAITQLKKWKQPNEEIPGNGAPILLAVAAIACITFIYLFTVVFVFVTLGTLPGFVGLLLLPALLNVAIKKVRKMKENHEQKLNRLPLYLLTIPVCAFFTFAFIIKPVSNFSRNYAIQRSQSLIAEVEQYKTETGAYPSSMESLYSNSHNKKPKPFIMGIDNFRYNKIENSYSISFSQWLELGSLEEIVLFDKSDLRHNLPGLYSKYDYSLDLCRAKGAFAGHDTKYDNWRYYHSD